MSAAPIIGGMRAADWVRRQLHYEPRDAGLFEQALTHRSAARANNERLEFLGDAVLNLIVAQHLYAQYPEADEGALSRLRALVVSGESLARLAGPLELGAALSLGAGELKTGGERRESILADALEAVCGAVYLEAGFEAARQVFLRVLAPALEAMDAAGSVAADGRKDAKTRLQEWLQARGLPLPQYTVVQVEGESHAQTFHVACAVTGLNASAQGVGLSRRRAEQAAAQQLLAQLAP
ncbi:MAG TPA: ribonuclease III [Steroidobacteraceae bacterium]|nr:ribonuclease III [Steroidobacteraceae bacterium]